MEVKSYKKFSSGCHLQSGKFTSTFTVPAILQVKARSQEVREQAQQVFTGKVNASKNLAKACESRKSQLSSFLANVSVCLLVLIKADPQQLEGRIAHGLGQEITALSSWTQNKGQLLY